MKNTAMQKRLGEEIRTFIDRRLTLQLATLGKDGTPFASYAPFAADENSLYVLLSDIATHGENLAVNPRASVLIIEDEDRAGELFARLRVSYQVIAEELQVEAPDWHRAIELLAGRHGERPRKLAQLADFHLFRLRPTKGRYVKGFGKAYSLDGGSLGVQTISHVRVGHKSRDETAA